MLKSMSIVMVILLNTMFSEAQTNDFYKLKMTDIDGAVFHFDKLKGKKVIIVNVAGECGYTPQYKELQELYEKYKDRLVIIGFPSNEFGNQEPGSDSAIKSFCSKNYGVTFLMMSKSSLKENKNEVYSWLCSKELNGVSDAEVKWNFNKFLIDENGTWVAYFPSKIKPFDSQIINWIENK